MNSDNLTRIAEMFGTKVEKKKSRMWHNVPHIHKTAMVLDVIIPRGGYALEKNPEKFPPYVDEAYVKDAIANGAVSLGELNRNNCYVFTPWDRRENYPQGYLTGKVGYEKPEWWDRVSCPLDTESA